MIRQDHQPVATVFKIFSGSDWNGRFEEGVEVDEKFAHDGGEGDFVGFAV